MDLITNLVIAVALAMDATAVSISLGTCMARWSASRAMRPALHFGIFQGAMPLLGWFLGRTVSHLVQRFDHWLAFGLLVIVAGHMCFEAFTQKKEVECAPVNERRLLVLAIATSIDALAVGLGFAFLNVSFFVPCLIIAVVTFVFSACGSWLGFQTKKLFGNIAEIIGATILVVIAVRILVTHLSQNI